MLRTVDHFSFFGLRIHPTPAQLALCHYTPWRDAACLARLCEIYRPKRYLEVGCNRGAMLALLADAFPGLETVGVDPGDQVAPGDRSPVQRDEYLPQPAIGELVRDRPNCAVYRCRFEHFVAAQPFDAVFIDGDHREQAVRRDLEQSLKLLAPGGWIALHDVGNPQTPGVRRVLEKSALEFTHVADTWFAFLAPSP